MKIPSNPNRDIPPTVLIYIDDSGDESCSILSALVVPVYSWRTCFNEIRQWRKKLNITYGISLRKELHAYKFVSGRGRPTSRVLTKHHRANIFVDALKLCAGFKDKDVCLFNVFCGQGQHVRCCELLVNRMQMFLSSFHGCGIMFFDEGYEREYTSLLRKMRVFNPIPSHFGGSYNAPAINVLEDPVFRDSTQSPFIQLVDFCAYALLRHEKPIPRTQRYGIGDAFAVLEPILMKKASSYNKYGIVKG